MKFVCTICKNLCNFMVRITELVRLVLVGPTAGHKASNLADENLLV